MPFGAILQRPVNQSATKLYTEMFVWKLWFEEGSHSITIYIISRLVWLSISIYGKSFWMKQNGDDAIENNINN